MATFIFDFDDTIFNTKRLKLDIFEKISSFGVDKKIVETTYKDTLSQNEGNYILKKHLENLFREKGNFAEIENETLNWFHNLDFKTYILPEIEGVLKNLKEKNTLILLTKGNPDFQNIKIEKSELGTYFEEINIVEGKKEEFLESRSYNDAFFINDKESENEIIRTRFPNIKTINPNRKGGIAAPFMDC